ncbi:hypothetical protein SAMN02910406_03186 [Ruminococcus albus]|uniref:SMI1 / KNR4 family (SUKH-1) n=2 Tax=Ruminococcus albus TaxID=1264 RepID=A0A1I1Q2Q0_RUMAL|nr:hypothetical protein SAMN02910406_03186 [Ruminococcus albus]
MYTDFLSKLPDAATYEKLSQEKISNTEQEFYSLFNVEFPKDYIELLHFTNGLSFDGQSICGVYDEKFLADHPRKKSMDILRFNSSFRDLTDITDYIMLGKSGIDYIVYNIGEKKFQILSNGTMECFGTFDSFLDLLYAFFEVERQ